MFSRGWNGEGFIKNYKEANELFDAVHITLNDEEFDLRIWFDFNIRDMSRIAIACRKKWWGQFAWFRLDKKKNKEDKFKEMDNDIYIKQNTILEGYHKNRIINDDRG